MTCSFCHSPLEEYAWHERGVKGPVSRRYECPLCGPSEPDALACGNTGRNISEIFPEGPSDG